MAKVSTTQSNGANLGFEATLWKAADALRANMDAAEYKHVVLGLIFLTSLMWTPKTGESTKLLLAVQGGVSGGTESEGLFGVAQGAGGVGGAEGRSDGERVGVGERGSSDDDPCMEKAVAGRGGVCVRERRDDVKLGARGARSCRPVPPHGTISFMRQPVAPAVLATTILELAQC